MDRLGQIVGALNQGDCLPDLVSHPVDLSVAQPGICWKVQRLTLNTGGVGELPRRIAESTAIAHVVVFCVQAHLEQSVGHALHVGK
jgi:hypothetical protein